MRISTNTIFSSGLARLSDLQSSIIKKQQEISTGRKVLSPSDDPVGAARALNLQQAQAINTQLSKNRESVTTSLMSEESVLQGTTSLLQDVKTLTVNAGSGILNDTDRSSLAVQLQGQLDELVGQANETDGTGSYLFAGAHVTSPPFSSNGTVYSGDQNQRLVQVSTARSMAMTDTGNTVFQTVASSGVYTTGATSTNSGGAGISALTLTDSSSVKNHDYTINFSVAAGVTTYSVQDKTAGTTVSSGNTFQTGQPIIFDGRSVAVTSVSSAPADGDSFAITQNKTQSVFKTISDLITALKTPTTTPDAKANLAQSLAIANGNIDNALNNVLTIRASIGSRLQELDSLNTAGSARDLQYSTTLSQIQDVDYNQAISEYTQLNTTLQAAQKSFITISGLSLFNLMP